MRMLKYWERVETLRKEIGYSQADLAEKVGINPRTYTGWIYRNVLPDVKDGTAIANALNASSDYLLTGEETALPDDDYVKENKSLIQTPKGIVIQEDEEPSFLVPVVSQKISAGIGEEFLSEAQYIGKVRVLERMTRNVDKSSLIAATVKGDSMTGVQIFDGDLVIFARGHISENGLYVLSLYGEVKVKRLEFRTAEQKIYIHSENPRYSTETVTMDNENITILGKVVGWVHSHPY